MTQINDIPFKRNAVAPMTCLSEGFNLIKDRYWFFVGMCFVALLIGGAVPFGILMGPMMCGLFMAFFQKRQGLPIEFGTLFKGFDHFGQSVIATLIHIVPIVVILVPAYLLFYVGLFVTMVAGASEEGNPTAVLGFTSLMILFWLAIFVVIIVISIAFTFSYPLIVDRRMQAIDAVKLSAKAAMANFWKLLGLSLMSGLIGFLGVLCCYVGVFFVFPISYSAIAVAYEQVFGLSNTIVQPDLPPPPPVFS